MPEKELMIYIAHGADARRKVVEANLELLNFTVGLSTASPAVLIRRCQENPPDAVIIGSEFEDQDAFSVLNELSRENICPVIALLKREDVERSRRLMDDQVMGVLVEPLHEGDLRTSIYLARLRFAQAKRMESRIDELLTRLGDDNPTVS